MNRDRLIGIGIGATATLTLVGAGIATIWYALYIGWLEENTLD